jgi:hypothetical protein
MGIIRGETEAFSYQRSAFSDQHSAISRSPYQPLLIAES